jgi:hypothetical protein
MPSLNQSQIDLLRFYHVGIKVGPKASTAYTSTIAQTLFTITGGKVLVKLLMATVTTIHQVTTLNIKTATAPTVGTGVALSSDVDTTGLEAGGTIYVEGDGTASVKALGGTVLSSTTPLNTGFIATTGSITFTPSATATGATNWELWYIPIDDGAAVVAA